MRSVQPLPAVLVVDDTPSIQQLLLHTLRDLVPYDLVAVDDATAALAVLAARPVPLVITDYHLSDMRGDALVAEIKAASPTTKVLMITADVGVDGSEEWLDVDRCLIKPFPLHELVSAVRTLLPSNERAR
ncbi:MAG TPA: response regulator [Roseiflexaceae bacterium]|nr:response regulator [Roseiflexaceae bacterium]